MKTLNTLFIALACCMPAMAQPTRTAPDTARLDYRLQPRQIAPGTWVIEGAVADFLPANGCNIINTAFIATGDGVIVINTGPSRVYGEQQRRAITATLAAVTPQPVRRVLNLNLHPDYFFGNQAWDGVPTQALAGSIAGMQAEGESYADNLYRLCGGWMRGTQATPARQALEPGSFTLGDHHLELRRLQGHTGDDLVLLDHSTGVLFAGGLVFADRVPTTPHADPAQWLHTLDLLAQWQRQGQFKQLVPSHGPVDQGLLGIAQTRDWLRWLTGWMQDSAQQGLDLSELLRMPVPERFAGWAAQPAELHRSLAQWYPAYERRALQPAQP
ncbi:quinoprotein relay system zinc metallohydrolase 1 [Paenacidovorax caeni]|uniref:Quinoprotein relay system zinc metallohydrolase 1 n=1 Tax=Paenacidovorax caeni TaxID=343013 RepID=A0A1I7FF40_9BURK|nr:quinoprotein relay system zinc metallohydrolase 1 [Paenacidovorax caeni]